MTGDGLRLGEVAVQAGVNVQALCHCERRGLRKEPARRPSGFRSGSAARRSSAAVLSVAPVVVALAFAAAAAPARGQDTVFTTSARTKDFDGEGLIPRFTYLQATHVFDGDSRRENAEQLGFRAFIETIGVIYGLREDLTLGATLPIVEEEFRMTEAGERVKVRANGIGDVPFLAKWRLFARREQAGTLEAALIGGLKLPTGDDGAGGEGRKLPPPLRLGSGSIDGIVGGALTWIEGRFGLNADTIYKANSEANDVRLGNTLRFDLGPNFRIYPGRYERSDELSLYGILELNGVYAERDEVSGERVLNSGGLKLFLSPGVQAIVTTTLLFEVGVQVPVFRHLHGPQLAEDFAVTAGFRWLF